jgi:hypothetical protein
MLQLYTYSLSPSAWRQICWLRGVIVSRDPFEKTPQVEEWDERPKILPAFVRLRFAPADFGGQPSLKLRLASRSFSLSNEAEGN